MLKCENYSTVITNRSRNLIHFLSNLHVTSLEVLFRSPSRVPVKKYEEKLFQLVTTKKEAFKCVFHTWDSFRRFEVGR